MRLHQHRLQHLLLIKDLQFRWSRMQLQLFLICSLILYSLTAEEVVDVVEAVSGSADDPKKDHHTAAEHKTDQLALESHDDVELPPKKLAYNGPRTRPNHNSYKYKNKYNSNSYNGPPPPLPPPPKQAMDKLGEVWPAPAPEMPKIVSLDVKCEKSSMKVYIGFDKPFYGIVFSKGHYSNAHCVHLPAGLGRTTAHFEIGIHACGTSGNTENGLYGYGAESGSGTFFENIIVIQYDAQVQEVWDQARKLRCTWHDQYEKSVTFRPFPVDMLDVVRTDFAGDNVGCWMQIQVGKGPWASEVSGLVKIGQTMTMVLAIKDDDSKFDMLVRNCMAHDGKRAPIQLVDQKGCVTRPKLMSRFTKIKNFGASASVLSYAHFQAFKFPDSMEVHFQCTIQICRYHCPDPCSDGLESGSAVDTAYGVPLPPGADTYLRSRDERRVRRRTPTGAEVGLNRVIRVVSTGDFTFSLADSNGTTEEPATIVYPSSPAANKICLTTHGFTITLAVLLIILIGACLMSAVLCIRLRRANNNTRRRNSSCANHVGNGAFAAAAAAAAAAMKRKVVPTDKRSNCYS